MKRNIEMREFSSQNTTANIKRCRVTPERFDKALRILGVRNPNVINARYQLHDIEAAYESHLDVLTMERQYCEVGDSEKQL